MIRPSASVYSNEPPHGRIMHMTGTPASRATSTAARMTPCEGVVPPTARLSHSSMRPAPAAIASGTCSTFSAQNSLISPPAIAASFE